MVFIQMAKGIDDETWLYHLHRHEYSNWFRYSIKDPDLAQSTEMVENHETNTSSSRQAITNLILNSYTLPG